MTDNKDKNMMTEKELNMLATKIVSRMLKVKSMEDWFNHVESTAQAAESDYSQLNLSEETEALGEAAKLMTLMNILQEDEEYEKCAIVKRRMKVINNILKKYK
jgi:hypothetical protein|tara:strand:- start:1594 stop:1902 length:309 start_codon:yes stop_codon:yes gene_type:complete